MVARKDLLQAKGEVHNVQIESSSREKDIISLREQNKKQAESAEGLRVALEELRLKMSEMVPRSKQLTCEAEAKAAKEEVQLKMREGAALQNTLDKARADNQALHAEIDGLQTAMSDMVQRSQLLAAKTEGKLYKDDAEAKDTEISLQKKYVAELKEQVNKFRNEVDDLQAQLATTAPKAQLLAAQEEERAAKGAAEVQAKEVVRLERIIQGLRAELSKCQKELDAWRSGANDKVPRIELLNAQSELADQIDKLARLEEELKAVQIHNAELKKVQVCLKEEIEAWKEKLEHMVPRPELMTAKNDARALAETLTEVRAQLDVSQADVRKFKEQMYGHKQEMTVMQEALADMVPRREHLTVLSDCKKVSEQKDSALREKDAVEKTLAQAHTENTALTKEVRELKNRMTNMSGKEELAAAKAEAKKLLYEADTLRSVQEALETQIKSLKARLANSVNRDQLAAEQTEASRARDELRVLKQQLHAAGLLEGSVLERLMETLSAKPAIQATEATELLLAVRSLQRGGMDEATELVKAIAARQPATNPSDVLRILMALESPQKRSITDVVRLLNAMSAKWTAEDAELLMLECESLDHLREILEVNRNFENTLIQEKEKRSAAQEELQALLDKLVPEPPKFEPSGDGASFTGPVNITITADCCSDVIFCTADGSTPSPRNYQAKGPSPFTFSLAEAATLRAASQSRVGTVSPIKSESYVIENKGGAGPMAGVGLLIEQEEGSEDVLVTRVTPGGAAAKDGTVGVGDRLISVDGRPVAGMHMPYIFKIVAGPAGSSVTLHLLRTAVGPSSSASSKLEFGASFLVECEC
jgi:chromosome segregation ATPase